jgi:hypothetical protein
MPGASDEAEFKKWRGESRRAEISERSTGQTTLTRVCLATAGGVFVALCLFGGLVWLIYETKARTARAALEKEV